MINIKEKFKWTKRKRDLITLILLVVLFLLIIFLVLYFAKSRNDEKNNEYFEECNGNECKTLIKDIGYKVCDDDKCHMEFFNGLETANYDEIEILSKRYLTLKTNETKDVYDLTKHEIVLSIAQPGMCGSKDILNLNDGNMFVSYETCYDSLANVYDENMNPIIKGYEYYIFNDIGSNEYAIIPLTINSDTNEFEGHKLYKYRYYEKLSKYYESNYYDDIIGLHDRAYNMVVKDGKSIKIITTNASRDVEFYTIDSSNNLTKKKRSAQFIYLYTDSSVEVSLCNGNICDDYKYRIDNNHVYKVGSDLQVNDVFDSNIKHIGEFICKNEAQCAFKSLNGTQTEMIFNNYDVIDDNYLILNQESSKEFIYIFSLKENKLVKIDGETVSEISHISDITLNNQKYYRIETAFYPNEYIILDKDYNKLIDTRSSYGYEVLDNDNLVVVFVDNHNQYFIYNLDGNKVYESKKYDIVNSISSKYINVTVNGEIKLMDLEENVICSTNHVDYGIGAKVNVYIESTTKPMMYQSCEERKSYYCDVEHKKVIVEDDENVACL